MLEIHRMFKHTGPRTPETDAIAEEYARHVVQHAAVLLPAGKLEVALEWVHHNQPDMWLLFATGTARKE